MISVKRMSSVSKLPPKYPETKPMVTPRNPDKARQKGRSELRFGRQQSNRHQMSRPRWSVPSGCPSEPGGNKVSDKFMSMIGSLQSKQRRGTHKKMNEE